jgi:aspartate dehydrogenase
MADLRVGIAGLGAIGRSVARAIAAGVPGLTLSAIAARDTEKARNWLAENKLDAPLISIDQMPDHADLAVECAPGAVLPQICRPMLMAGRKVMVLSAAALLLHPELIDLARENGGQIIVPSGALLGLDAVTAAAEGHIQSVTMTTRKPPNGLSGAPHLVRNDIVVAHLTSAKKVFSGSAREAAIGFPANVNVAAALSLAGIGPDRTTIEIWADPGVTRNCHSIVVVSDAATFTVSIENVPSDNPKTGRITAQSVMAALRKINAPLRIGT